jgi:hypothetical protein
MTQVRVTGYVVGYDEVGGEALWKLKVKDSSSVHNGKKFVVHSLHPGTMLSKPSVDVTFKVAPIQVGQEQTLKAVDVAIGEISSKIAHADTKPSDDADVINFFASELDGKVNVWLTGLKSTEEVQADLRGSDETLVAFFKIPLNEPSNSSLEYADAYDNSMTVLCALLHNDTIREAFEHMLSQVFVHGQNS